MKSVNDFVKDHRALKSPQPWRLILVCSTGEKEKIFSVRACMTVMLIFFRCSTAVLSSCGLTVFALPPPFCPLKLLCEDGQNIASSLGVIQEFFLQLIIPIENVFFLSTEWPGHYIICKLFRYGYVFYISLVRSVFQSHI